MDFFKSVFSEPTPDPSPSSSPTSHPPTSSWGFGSTLLQSIASKSESLIDNYYKDLQEFSSGFKKETSVIREAASRAVQELPARLESGAAIAQESLEAVGQAIDNVGSTVSDIIGKDLNFASNDRLDQSDDHDNVVGSSAASRDAELNFIANNAKPYSRIDAMIRALQCDIRTYIDGVEDSGFSDWELGFRLEERREEIEGLLDENSAIAEILGEVVPGNVDEETFWCRYFYRVDKVVKMEEARLKMVKRAISSEGEEELSWDVDDDDDDCDNGGEYRLKDDELNNKDGEEEKGNKLKDDGSSMCLASPSSSTMLLKSSKIVLDNEEGAGVSGGLVDDESLGERSVCHEKEEASEGKLGSDISIISSQRSSHGEDDLGWDEIEDIRSGDESNVGDAAVDVGKRVSGAEQDEELTWDIDDDEPVKL